MEKGVTRAYMGKQVKEEPDNYSLGTLAGSLGVIIFLSDILMIANTHHIKPQICL